MNFSNKILKRYSVPNECLVDIPLEYKRANPEIFKERGYTTEYVELEATNGYLSKQIQDNLSPNVENTVIINIGLGQGKSTAAQQMMKYYYQNGFIVMIASPFKSLVLKDYTYLTKDAGIPEGAIFNYNTLDTDREHIAELERKEWGNYFRNIAQKPIHILTINSLLGNPGDNAFLQNNNKREYLNSLLWYCKKNKKKVVFFFDEIHETVPNFQNELLFLLRRWKDVTLKAFILTATFTEPTYVVAMHIAYLTNDTIKIIESPRVKNPPDKQAELELYFCKEKYSSTKGFTELDYIESFVQEGEYERYHILSFSEKIAKALHEKVWKNTDNVILTIGSKKETFDRRLNNVGTTFKTGINIEKPDALIIICPARFGDFPSKGSSGIFYDGMPSILQSFGRLRNGGKILVFFPPPNNYINTITEEQKEEGIKQYTDFIQACFPDIIVTVTAENESYDTQLPKIQNIYNKMLERIKEEQEIYHQSNSTVNRPEIQFPTLDNFILTKGQQYLVHSQEKYGKNTAPFIIWAAFHNQFQNCTLKYITTHNYDYVEFISSKKSYLTDIVAFFKDVDKDAIKQMHPYKAVEYCMSLFRSITINGIERKVLCIIDGKEEPKFFISPRLGYWVIHYLQQVVHNKNYYLKKRSYILSNICRANKCPSDNIPELIKAYQVLGKLGIEFNVAILTAFTKSDAKEILLPKKNYQLFKENIEDFFDTTRMSTLKTHIPVILEKDKLIHTKKLSVLQKIDFTDITCPTLLNKLYSLFKVLFLVTNPVRKGRRKMDRITVFDIITFTTTFLRNQIEDTNMLDYCNIISCQSEEVSTSNSNDVNLISEEEDILTINLDL